MHFVRFGKVTFALFAFWLCVVARPAQAQIDLVNNLTDSTDGMDRLGGNVWQADAFQTDNHSYMLSAATLELSSASGDIVTVDIYSNTGSNKPGSSIVTLGTSNPLATTAADVTFTPLGALILQPNTVYWVVAHAPTSADWGATASTAYTGVGFIPPANAVATSGDSGSTWATLPLSDGPDKFRIQIAGTPEPGVFTWILGLGLAGACFLRRHHKS